MTWPRQSTDFRVGTPIRILFGAAGWPSGMLELASWAKREGLAETVIVPLRHSSPDEDLRPSAGLLAKVRRPAELPGELHGQFHADGQLPPAVGEAVAALGGSFAERLLGFRPHVVGFRIEGGDLEAVGRQVAATRVLWDAEIVIGGPTATSHPAEVLEATGADYVFAGEAEETFNQFLRLARLPDSKDLAAEIPGLAYRYGNGVYHNTLPTDGYERTVLDVDATACGVSRRCVANRIRPVTDTGVIRANRLDWSLLEGFEREFDSLYFTGGRGCPGACTFCAKLHGGLVRVKTAAQLLEEIAGADACVADGTIRVARWHLFEHVVDSPLREEPVVWAAVYDEDFFLDRRRAIEFFGLWERSPLCRRYRLGFQTNPCSLLAADGNADSELFAWIDRLKPMIQLGAESFNPDLLARWRKRHTIEQLGTVLDALDGTRQDYAVFILLSDFDTTPEELVETLRVLVLGALPRRRMRIASSPFTIPLYDSQTRRSLEYGGRLGPDRVRDFTDYERGQPQWMDALAAELANLADAELHFALNLPDREGALFRAFEVVLERIRHQRDGVAGERLRMVQLLAQAERAMDQIKDARFQAVMPLEGGSGAD